MTKQKRSRDRVHFVKLSEKEIAIMREEHDDRNGAQRNIPLFRQMLLGDHELTMMLYDPTLMPMLMSQIIRNISSKHVFTTETTKNEEFLQEMSRALLPHFNANGILNDLIRITKETKVKREKRALLWAVGDLMAVAYRKAQPQNSYVFQTIVTTSIDNATRLSQMANVIREGSEPFNFNYEDYMEGPIKQDKFEQLQQTLGPQLSSLQRILSLWAMEAFEQIKKPFGLPFCDILHYPSAFPKKKSSLILSSNDEASSQDEEMSDDEKYEKLFLSLRKDRMIMTAQEVARNTVQSMKSAAFGEVDANQLKGYLNAATFSLLFPYIDNPLLIRLYERSGEQAGELIPADEKGDWIEIISSPENPQGYRNYGDTLLQKDNWNGARKAYMLAGELMEEIDDELQEKIESLNLRLLEQDKELLQHHHHHHDHECNDPSHHHHD